MILPIYAYGQPVLKKKAKEIDADFPGLEKLIADIWETMYHANGIGLAAPQIGKSIRLFLVDTEQLKDEDEEEETTKVKKVFINATKVEEEGEVWPYEEGCLSIPDITGEVERPEQITLRYFDEDFNEHVETFTGINARVIQHEYDHVDGVLFVEHLKPVRKQLIRRKLEGIRKGKAKAKYHMKFYSKK
jgi:peptide deformylase